MQISSQPVNVNDTIQHVLLGAGVVQSVESDRCVAQFPSGLITVFDGGLTGGIRTCYWQDIRQIDPPKDLGTWLLIVDVASRIKAG